MGSFEAIRTSHPRAHRLTGCPRCDAPKNEGQVSIRIQELSGSRLGHQVTGKAKSLCEECCVEVYEAILEVFEEEIESEQ